MPLRRVRQLSFLPEDPEVENVKARPWYELPLAPPGQRYEKHELPPVPPPRPRVDRSIVLVSCSASKATEEKDGREMPARELYVSALFRKSLELGERCYPGFVLILSARYGAIDPDHPIVSYNESVSDMRQRDRDYWAGNVITEIYNRFGGGKHRLVILAGRDYADPIRLRAEGEGWEVDEPMAGMMIGERLSWLNTKLDECEL